MSPGLMRDETGGIADEAYVLNPIRRFFYNERIFSTCPLSANFTKWSNTLKQFVGKFPTNCLSVFDHFVGLALKEISF